MQGYVLRRTIRWLLVCGVAFGLLCCIAYVIAGRGTSRTSLGKLLGHTPAVRDAGGYRKIHVFVALCDNRHQGIVPVPAAIGNGQDPPRNLYWGARYGVKTYFLRSHEWKLVGDVAKPEAHILERLIFKHRRKKALLVADAYDGACMRETITDLLTGAAGMNAEEITVGGKPYAFGGGAQLLAFVGHDGLMDFRLDLSLTPSANPPKDVLLFCCASRPFFRPWIARAGANPLIWTTNLMCPEAYTLKAAVDGWLNHEPPNSIRERVAREYSAYQRCSVRAARKLFVTGN